MECRLTRKRTYVTTIVAFFILIIGGQDTIAQKSGTSGEASTKEPIDVTGTWLLIYSFGDPPDGHADLRLEQIQRRLIVHIKDSVGRNRDIWVQQPDGTIIGNRVTFYQKGLGQGVLRVIYTGTVEKDTIKGTISSGATWMARRLSTMSQQQSRDVPRTPVRPSTSTREPLVPARIAEPGVNEIAFAEINSREILRSYPFVKNYLERTQNDMEIKGPLLSPQVLVADIRDGLTHLNLLFLYERRDPPCKQREYNDHGCGFYVWADEGNGYKEEPVMAAWSKLPLYLLKDRERTSLILCVQKERFEWSFENHTFQGPKGPITRTDISACN